MKKDVRVKKFLSISILIALHLFTSSQYFCDTSSNEKTELNGNFEPIAQDSIVDNYQKQWIENPSFNSPIDQWFFDSGGDITDISASVEEGQSNFEINGESGVISLIDHPPSASNWTESDNPDFPNKPDNYEINSEGCWASHLFDDQTAVQTVCIEWDKNITLPMDMSDYIISSASVRAIVNATVDENLDRYWDYYYGRRARIDPDAWVNTYGVGDFVRFYVMISDMEKDKTYEVAYFQTVDIGSGNAPGSGEPNLWPESRPRDLASCRRHSARMSWKGKCRRRRYPRVAWVTGIVWRIWSAVPR